MSTTTSVPNPDLTEAERASVARAVEARVNDYGAAARRCDLAWFRSFWADVDGFVVAADGALLNYATWDYQLETDLAAIQAMTDFEFFDGHTFVLAHDAAVHTTQFRWSLVSTDGDTMSMHGSWSYVFKKFGGTWKVVHSAGTHLSD